MALIVALLEPFIVPRASWFENIVDFYSVQVRFTARRTARAFLHTYSAATHHNETTVGSGVV